MTYNRMQHDFGIVDPTLSTNVVGLVCVRDPKTGEILYKEYDDEYLAQQFFTGGASYVNTPPQRRLPIPLSDYRSGFGLDIYDSNDSKRYFSSYGVDLRFKDRATLSYGATSATMPSIADFAITNADMELDSNWTTLSGASNTRSDVQKRSGTYSRLLDNSTVVYQDILTAGGTWDNAYRGCYVSFTCWALTGTVGKGRIHIDDGITDNAGTASHTGGGAFEQLSVSAYLGATATRLRIKMSDLGQPVYFDDFAITIQPSFGTTAIGIDFNDKHYVAKGNVLLKLNAGGTGFDTVRSFPATITDLKVFGVSGTDYLFIALGLSTPYQYMVAAETFTISNATDKTYQFFQPVYTTASTFYGNDTNSTIRSTTNPLNGGVAWTAITQVDSDLYDITGLKSMSGALYIAKEDKPYYLSAGAVQNDLAPECESAYTTTSGANSDIWLGNWYYPYGAQYLLEIGSTNTRRNPSEFCTSQADFTGRVAAVTHDGDQWLIVCLNNTTKVEVLMGRLEDIDGTTDWVWHPYKELTMGNCNAAWTSNVYQKRIWIASATSGESLQYIPLPTGYGNLTADTNKLYNVSATANYFETPFLHGNFKADTKGWIKVVATLGHAYDAGIYWTIQYKKLEDSSYTNTGNLVGTATNRTHTLYLPVDASSYKPTSTMMRFKVIGVTNDTAKTPVLNSLVIEAVLYPPDGSGNVIACTVKDIKTMITGKGGEGEKGSQTLIKNVIDAALAATYPVTIYDIEGTTRTVKFMPLPTGTPRRFPVRKSGQEIDWNYNLIMSEVTTS